MKLNEKQFKELLEVSKPLIKWLNENCHPHCSALVDCTRVELVESVAQNRTEEFIKD